ncbi:MAG: MDR family MFS transporter [Acidimicrobiia bacterium]
MTTGGAHIGRVSRAVLVVFIGTQLGMILSTLDGTIVATALPTIARDLGHDSQRSWVITAYLLGMVATMPLYGKLGDLYGRKRMYLVAMTVFTVGSMLCGAAGSMGQLIAFRALQGVGAGGIGPLAMAIVADIVPARQLGRWLGYQGALFAVASLIGPFTGGFFVDHLTWRWAFYVNLPLAAVAMFIVGTRLQVPYQRVVHAIDYAGSALLTAALATIVVVAAIGGRTVSWVSTTVIGLAIVIVLLAIAFVARERRAPEPVLPLRILSTRVVRVAAAINLTSGALFAAGIYFIPVFLQQVANVSATTSGLLLAPFMFTTAFTTLVAGRRVERSGRYRVWPILGSVIATVGVVLLSQLGLATPASVATAFGAVLGTGIGFIMQTSLLALQNSVEYRDLGVATSTALLSRTLGVTLGAALCSAVLQARLPASGIAGSAAYADAIPMVYLAAIPIALVTIVLALRLPEHRLRDGSHFEIDEPHDVVALHAAAETGLA